MSSAPLRGLRLAVSTLTVWPLRGPAVIDRDAGRAAMLWAPLVGLLVGLPAALVVYAGRRYLSSLYEDQLLVPAVLGVTTLVVLTRGLHVDGLADTVDGLASYRPAQEALEIMRRGDVGPLGLTAVVLTLLLQVATLSSAIVAHHGTVGLLVAVLTGRCALTLACRAGTPVAAGSILGAVVVGTVPRAAAALVAVLTVAGCGVAGSLDRHTLDPRFEVAQALVAAVAGLAAAELLRRHALRRLDGLSGDVLGALVEVSTTVALLVMSAQHVHR